MKFALEIPPMPFQLVNESSTDAIVGPQIRARSKNRGMPTIKPRASLSRRVSRL